MTNHDPRLGFDNTIRPGLRWLDDRGRHIQAHGGAVIKVGDLWYWFGEDRSPDNDPDRQYVACYASRDLVHWQFRNQVVRWTDPAGFGPSWVIQRPKVYHNAKTGRFVMYMHLDGRMEGSPDRYAQACVGVATCDTVDGNYQFHRHFRPLGQKSYDIGQFIDDDGSAYLIFESRPTGGFFIARLSDDYLDVESPGHFVSAPLEGGGIVRHDGLYYMIGSHLTGWWPNANKYATAERLEGPWSEFRDVAPPETHTYCSQSTNLLKVVGSQRTTVIYLGDRWMPEDLGDSRYIWMPLEIGGGSLRLPKPGPWTLDAQTGVATILPEFDSAKSPPLIQVEAPPPRTK